MVVQAGAIRRAHRGAEVHVITIAGEWDLSRADELREYLAPAVSHENVALDLSNLTYVDQFCVAMLLRVRTKRIANGYAAGSAVLPRGPVRRILDFADFCDFWLPCETLQEALSRAS